MQDWLDRQLRYLVHFDEGGSGMRRRDEPLQLGCELDDGGRRYRIVRVPGRAPSRMRHASMSLRRVVRSTLP